MARFRRKSDDKEVEIIWCSDGYQISEITEVKTLSEVLREHVPIDEISKAWKAEWDKKYS